MSIQHRTKKQLQEKYGISNADFRVLVQSAKPSKSDCEKNGEIIDESVTWFFGIPTYLIRSSTGMVLAVLLVAGSWGEIEQKVSKLADGAAAVRDYMRFPNQSRPYDITFKPQPMANIGTTSSTIMHVTFTNGTGNV